MTMNIGSANMNVKRNCANPVKETISEAPATVTMVIAPALGRAALQRGIAGAARRQACRGIPGRQPCAADGAPAEILAILASRARGWTAEELAYELYGNAGTPQATRTETFRVRTVLGDAVVVDAMCVSIYAWVMWLRVPRSA